MNQDTLVQLAMLCQQLRDAERDVDTATTALKNKLELVRRLEEDDIPSLMSELAVNKLRLETGEEISVGLEVYASIPKHGQADAFAWLEGNGHGGLIKTEVGVSFGRDELELAQAHARRLAEQGLNATLERAVHAGTLKAFIKEQLRDGKSLPLELFGARSVNKAKIK